jgi:hypothetical protein
MNKLNFFDKETQSLRFTIWINLILAVISIAGLFWDSRTVGGINPWIKPFKFEISIIIFLATMAWILRYLEPSMRRKIAWQTAACMLIEISIICLQAARGISSHFNRSENLDFILFAFMGLAIGYNTYVLIKLFLLFVRGSFSLPKVYLRSIQYGIASILIATIPGGMMIARNSHTVGDSDGGQGLPFLNWSLIHGDLRIAHFMGMHGFQIFIILGAILTFSSFKVDEHKGIFLLNLSFVTFLMVTTGALVQALLGHPMLTHF